MTCGVRPAHSARSGHWFAVPNDFDRRPTTPYVLYEQSHRHLKWPISNENDSDRRGHFFSGYFLPQVLPLRHLPWPICRSSTFHSRLQSRHFRLESRHACNRSSYQRQGRNETRRSLELSMSCKTDTCCMRSALETISREIISLYPNFCETISRYWTRRTLVPGVWLSAMLRAIGGENLRDHLSSQEYHECHSFAVVCQSLKVSGAEDASVEAGPRH